MDIKDYYYLAAEYLDCRACNGTFISWDARILQQLPHGLRARFPVILTHKYACDQSVVSLLRARTFGNTPTALQCNFHELHSNQWLLKQVEYLSECDRHRKSLLRLHQPVPQYPETPSFCQFVSAKWFLAVYLRDVWSRLPLLLAEATSVYGTILKIDSTKKICRKLQG